MSFSRAPTKHNLPFRGVDNDPAFYSALYESVREIRYLDLHPGCSTDPVLCSLGCATLDSVAEESLSYEALSYCWGSVDDTTEIKLHGLPRFYPGRDGRDERDEPFSGAFRVTRNLKEALLALRYRHKTRRLWVDAICINQMDATEKTHQVGHMNKIYESAEQVIVWLGPADEHSIAVFNWGERMQSEARRFRGDQEMLQAATIKHEIMHRGDWRTLSETFSSLLVDAEQHSRVTKRSYRMRNARELEISFVRTLDTFLGRPWFRRVWVYPEVFSAKRGVHGERLVTIHVGEMTLRWHHLVEVVHTITNCDPTLFPKEVCGNLALFQNAWYWPTYGEGTGCGLADYLSQTSELLASDPRDKIFALWHVAHDTRHRIHTDARLLPDYNKSLLDILLDYSRAGITLPLVMRTNRDLEATSTFFFGVWIEHYDYQSYAPQLLSFQHPDRGPFYHPYQATVSTIINKLETYLPEGKEVYISTSVDGRYFLSDLPTRIGDTVVSCKESETTFLLSPLVVGDIRCYRFRGTCTPITWEQYKGHISYYATLCGDHLKEPTIMAPPISRTGTPQMHSPHCAGPGILERHSAVMAPPQGHQEHCTGSEMFRDQAIQLDSPWSSSLGSSYRTAAPTSHVPSCNGAHSSYAEASDAQNVHYASSTSSCYGQPAQINPLKWIATQYFAMHVQGHPATCNGSHEPVQGHPATCNGSPYPAQTHPANCNGSRYHGPG